MALKSSVKIKFAQFMLFIINCVFVGVGIFIATIPYNTAWYGRGVGSFVEVEPYIIALGLIGFFICVLSFFGGIATVVQYVSLLNLYSVLLCVYLLLGISAVITVYFMHGSPSCFMNDYIYTGIEEKMVSSLSNLAKSPYLITEWDEIQNQLYCCGIRDSKDWAIFNVSGPELAMDGTTYTVPYSCCKEFYLDSERSLHCNNVPLEGCLTVLSCNVSRTLYVCGSIARLLIILQLLGLLFTQILSRTIRSAKTEEEMKRQQFQHLIYNEQFQHSIYSDLHKPQEKKHFLTTSS